MSIKEFESIINNSPKQKAWDSDGFTGDFYQTFKKEIIQILNNLFQNIQAERIPFNSFYEARFGHIPKPDKDIIWKRNL